MVNQILFILCSVGLLFSLYIWRWLSCACLFVFIINTSCGSLECLLLSKIDYQRLWSSSPLPWEVLVKNTQTRIVMYVWVLPCQVSCTNGGEKSLGDISFHLIGQDIVLYTHTFYTHCIHIYTHTHPIMYTDIHTHIHELFVWPVSLYQCDELVWKMLKSPSIYLFIYFHGVVYSC